MNISVPPVIHSLWSQGMDGAPEIVHACFNRWRAFNPEYDLRIYHQADVERLLRDAFPFMASIPVQALSDIFRARLLLEEGGIWVDATVYPSYPLRQWLPEAIAGTGFFAFSSPGADRLISSWFLAASPGHLLMQAWWREICRFWSAPRSMTNYSGKMIPPDPLATVSAAGNTPGAYPYFWFHYLFHYALETNPDCKAAWDDCKKLAAIPATLLQQLVRTNRNPTAHEIMEATQCAPVQKLDWRLKYLLAGDEIVPAR